MVRVAVIVFFWLAALPGSALASQLIARDASDVSLQVDRAGRALLTYRVGGRVRHVLAWGAVNARPPAAGLGQVRFRLDYSGGLATFGHRVSRRFRNACSPAKPALRWLITACRAPDGSFWAVQSWQRGLPSYGLEPTPQQAAWELRLSHWTGRPARLEVRMDWAYRRFHHLFGRLTYRGRPVYGFRTTGRGRPLDAFGRNVYVDTYNSAYGPGWRRENAVLSQAPHGGFCYGFYPHRSRPAGTGIRYRATAIGPGVTPDVSWEGPVPGPYDPSRDGAANAVQRNLYGPRSHCRVS